MGTKQLLLYRLWYYIPFLNRLEIVLLTYRLFESRMTTKESHWYLMPARGVTRVLHGSCHGRLFRRLLRH